MILSVIIIIGLAITFHKWIATSFVVLLGLIATPFIPFILAFKLRLKRPKTAKALFLSGCCFAFSILVVLLIPHS